MRSTRYSRRTRVLDVAAGNGNVSLAAARRGCDVIATDYVPACWKRRPIVLRPSGCRSISAKPMQKRFPLRIVASMSSSRRSDVMFTPDQSRAAAEMIRVCKPGGKIGLANWTPDGFIGQLFKTIGRHVPPPAGVKSPALWGTQHAYRRAVRAESLRDRDDPRDFVFRYRSPQHWLDVFRTYYGPLLKAFAACNLRLRRLWRAI